MTPQPRNFSFHIAMMIAFEKNFRKSRQRFFSCNRSAIFPEMRSFRVARESCGRASENRHGSITIRIISRPPVVAPPSRHPPFPGSTPSQSGHATGSVVPVFRNGAPYVPGSRSADPLSGPKVLEDFPEQGVRMSGCDVRWVLRRRMHSRNAQVLRRRMDVLRWRGLRKTGVLFISAQGTTIPDEIGPPNVARYCLSSLK